MIKTITEIITPSTMQIYDAMPLGISIVDRDLLVLYQNSAVYGWLPDMLKSSHLFVTKISDFGRVADFMPEIELERIKSMVFAEGWTMNIPANLPINIAVSNSNLPSVRLKVLKMRS